ncbi:MAG: cell wall hydrolase [Clostridia bacterium]|nr:cell wall hydrolase [Clostridia bacterium]
MKLRCTDRKVLSALFAIFAICLPMAIYMPAAASDPAPAVYADGWEYPGLVTLREGRAYVSLREFATHMDNSVVTWNEADMCATASTDSLTVSAWENGSYLVANGRYLWCPGKTYTENGIMMVPLTAVARAFGFDHTWADNTVYLERHKGSIESGEIYYDTDEVWWLAKIIHAEAQGEPFTGKIAVGEVILNRVESEEFPDTIYSVIFDNEHGVQFTPTVNGAIEEEPGIDSIIAAKLVLDGARVGRDLLYFLNPSAAVSTWIPENRDFYMTIGSHDFYT